MSTVYNLCKLLIDRGRTEGLQEKMDVCILHRYLYRTNL